MTDKRGIEHQKHNKTLKNTLKYVIKVHFIWQFQKFFVPLHQIKQEDNNNNNNNYSALAITVKAIL